MAYREDIPLSKLVKSDRNVRKTPHKLAAIEEMAASLAAQGLIQNLAVTPTSNGKYAVDAGERRRLAYESLRKRRLVKPGTLIPCLVLEEGDDPQEISLAENAIRDEMHPADQFEAFAELIMQGKSVSDVSSRFGVSEAFVRQRMKLASVSPRLLDAYRREEMTLETLMAFTVSNDHTAQERAWDESAEWQRQPHQIRVKLMGSRIRADDSLARFVGLEAYEQAGGSVTRDLFTPDAFLHDSALVERLAEVRLAEKAAELKGLGWSWVETAQSLSWDKLRPFQRLQGAVRAQSNEEKDEAERIRAELARLEDLDDDATNEFDELTEKLAELEQPPRVYTADQMAISGVMVGIDHRGGWELHHGLARAGDKTPTQNLDGAEPSEAVPSEKPLSGALIEELTAQRTAALRIELARNSRVALVAVVHRAVQSAFHTYERPSCLEITHTQASLDRHLADATQCGALRELDECRKAWKAKLPSDGSALWTWLLYQDTPILLELLAVAVAASVNTVEQRHPYETSHRTAHGQDLAEALELNMAAWWEPTAASYFSRIPKQQIVAAVREQLSDNEADAIAAMKKVDAAGEAERLMAGTGWLPQQLRRTSIVTGDIAADERLLAATE